MNGINESSFERKISHFKKVALDSSCFIYSLSKKSVYKPLTYILFRRIELGELKSVTSTISVIEVLVRPEKEKDTSFIDEAVRLLEDFPNLETYPVTFDLAQLAAKVRAKYNFRTPDAIQLALAIQEKVDAFITNDKRLKAFKEVKVLVLKDFLLA